MNSPAMEAVYYQTMNGDSTPRPPSRLFIDGYNFIFRLARHALFQRREVQDLKNELEELVRSLGEREGIQPWIVYDGRRLGAPPSGAPLHPHLRASYAEFPAEADDLIFQMSSQVVAGGGTATVVTSDQKLAGRLRGAGVRIETVEAFRSRMARAIPSASSADFIDIERHFLLLSEDEEQALSPATHPALPGAAAPRPLPLGMTERERRRKRGRRRQQRRLEAIRETQRRRKGRR
ncbi:MAG: NYN domain-containing protein [Acidobacteriota bacterium]